MSLTLFYNGFGGCRPPLQQKTVAVLYERRNLRHWIIFLGMFILAGSSGPVGAQTRSTASSSKSKFVAYADRQRLADQALLKAEHIHESFTRLLGIKSRPGTTSVVLVLGRPSGQLASGNGVVRAFKTAPDYKLQINWDELPISHDSFRRGCVRALCTRQAIEIASKQSHSGKELASKDDPKWRVPIWVTDGVAAMLDEPEAVEEVFGRASLLAKMKVTLSLDQAIAELEGKSELDAAQCAIAAVFCRALIQGPETCARLTQNFHWNERTTFRSWLELLLGRKDLDAWWMQIWKRQAGQFCPVKLGFVLTLRKVHEWEKRLQTAPELHTRQTSAEELIAGFNAAHPWFRPWILRQLSDSNRGQSEQELMELRRDIQLRRSVSLEWFGQLLSINKPFTRQDLILWDLAHRDCEKIPLWERPAEQWFDSVLTLKGTQESK